MADRLHVISTAALLAALPKATKADVILVALRCRPFVPTDALIDAAWGDNPEGGPDFAQNALTRHIWTLRNKGYQIENAYGQGYRLLNA